MACSLFQSENVWPSNLGDCCSYLTAVHSCLGMLLEGAVNFAWKTRILCQSDTQSLLACGPSKKLKMPEKNKMPVVYSNWCIVVIELCLSQGTPRDV